MTNEEKFLEEVWQLSGEDLMLITLGTNVMKYAIKQLKKNDPRYLSAAKKTIVSCRANYANLEHNLRGWRQKYGNFNLEHPPEDLTEP